MQGLHNAGGMPAGPNGPTELGLPARCCDTGGFWAAAAERVSATTKVAAKSVVFTRFLLFDFFAIFFQDQRFLIPWNRALQSLGTTEAACYGVPIKPNDRPAH